MFRGSSLTTQERDDLVEVMNDWLGSNCPHDHNVADFETPSEYAEFYTQYARVAVLYYVFTGQDFSCGHGNITRAGRAVI